MCRLSSTMSTILLISAMWICKIEADVEKTWVQYLNGSILLQLTDSWASCDSSYIHEKVIATFLLVRCSINQIN